MATLKSYQSMARVLGVPYCRGMLPTGHYCHRNHREGEVLDGTVHWLDRNPIPRADMLIFLKLCARAQDPTLDTETMPWRRVYRLDRAVRTLAAQIGIRFSAQAWRHDKAFVLAGIAGLANDVSYRKQAFDWARR